MQNEIGSSTRGGSSASAVKDPRSGGGIRKSLEAGEHVPFIMHPSLTAREELPPEERARLILDADRRVRDEYARNRISFERDPKVTPAPVNIDKKMFQDLLKREEALCALWFRGEGSGFLPFIFPIRIGELEIGNWGEAERAGVSAKNRQG
jgi:hypothetical protein